MRIMYRTYRRTASDPLARYADRNREEAVARARSLARKVSRNVRNGVVTGWRGVVLWTAEDVAVDARYADVVALEEAMVGVGAY